MSDEFLDELQRNELFRDLHHRHLKQVTKLVEHRAAREGEELVHEGSYSGDFFVVLDGSAAVSVRGKKRATVARGDFFGELSLLGHQPSATVTAMSAMRLAVFDGKEFFHLLENEPSIAMHLIQRLIARLETITVRPLGELI